MRSWFFRFQKNRLRRRQKVLVYLHQFTNFYLNKSDILRVHFLQLALFTRLLEEYAKRKRLTCAALDHKFLVRKFVIFIIIRWKTANLHEVRDYVNV